jgi:hypothetical protein
MTAIICVAWLFNPAPILVFDKPLEVKPAVTSAWQDRKVKFEGSLGTQFEGLVIALLGSCADGGQRDKAKEEMKQALKSNHIRVQFSKPRAFAVTGTLKTVEADEIVVPISASAAPAHIYVRSGTTYMSFAKYEFKIELCIREALKSSLGR